MCVYVYMIRVPRVYTGYTMGVRVYLGPKVDQR